MRRLITIAAALLFGVAMAVPVTAKEWTEQTVVLTDTTIFGIPAELVSLAPPAENEPGVNWVSAGVWHARNLPVADTVRDPSTGAVLGMLTRSVNFNLNLTTFASQAWCTFEIEIEGRQYEGNCRGSLITGTLNGHGDGVLKGTYQLGADGVPGVGPYFLTLVSD